MLRVGNSLFDQTTSTMHDIHVLYPLHIRPMFDGGSGCLRSSTVGIPQSTGDSLQYGECTEEATPYPVL